MRNLHFVLLALASLGLVGCTATYQSQNDGTFSRGWMGSGYSESKMADDVYQVSYTSNGFTTVTKSTDYALLRSAELALENGYPYFAIVNQSVTSLVSCMTVKFYKEKPANETLVFDAAQVEREKRALYNLK